MSVATISASPPNGPALVGEFDRFIGIDWSGAKGECHPNIVVAAASCGEDAPKIVSGPKHGLWSRPAVLDRLAKECGRENMRTLVGIDFAFAHPFRGGCYYPGSDICPDSPRSLWREIEKIAAHTPDAETGHFHAADSVKKSRLGGYYKFNNHTGTLYESVSERFRKTELAAKQQGRKPTCSFDGQGQKGVATGSLAGMRMLHALKGETGDKIAVWPFDAPDNASLVVVEIYPSFFFARVGASLPKNKEGVNNFLREHCDSNPLPESFRFCDNWFNDERDAIVSAAALRHLSGEKEMWEKQGAAEKEGWIFGVKPKADA